jgi:hypothetical protein
MMPQFRLRSLFIVTAIVAVGCWVGPPIVGIAEEMSVASVVGLAVPVFCVALVVIGIAAVDRASPPTD